MESEHPAKRIRFLIRTCNTTVQDLASKVGIPLEVLMDIIAERTMPPPSLLRRIGSVLGSKDGFLGEASSDPAPAEEPRKLAQASGSAPPTQKLDFAELAARHEALLAVLVERKVLTREEYACHLRTVRTRLLAEKPPEAASGRTARARSPGRARRNPVRGP